MQRDFHGRAVVASLKPRRDAADELAARDFHGRAVVASLKLRLRLRAFR